MSSGDTGSGEYVLRAKVDNVVNLSQLLKCIHFKENAVCFASESGLKIVVEDSACVQAAAFIGKDIFQEYDIKEEIIGFRIDLNILLDFLTILNDAASVDVYYRGMGFPLRLVLVEDDVITDCSIKTMDPLEIQDFKLPSEEVTNRMIFEGTGFKEVISDIDQESEYFDLLLSPDPPYFAITTRSTAGVCETSLSKNAEMIEEFVASERQSLRFRLSHVKPALKIFQSAVKISLQTGSDGLLCFQFMVKTEASQLAYIEYFCTPVVDE